MVGVLLIWLGIFGLASGRMLRVMVTACIAVGVLLLLSSIVLSTYRSDDGVGFGTANRAVIRHQFHHKILAGMAQRKVIRRTT